MDYKGTSGYTYQGLNEEQLNDIKFKRLKELELNLFLLEMQEAEYDSCRHIAEPEELPEIIGAMAETQRKIAFGKARLEAISDHYVPPVNVKESSPE